MPWLDPRNSATLGLAHAMPRPVRKRLCARFLNALRCLTDHLINAARLGYHRDVAGRQLGHFGVHAFREEALEIGLNRPIFFTHDVVGRL